MTSEHQSGLMSSGEISVSEQSPTSQHKLTIKELLMQSKIQDELNNINSKFEFMDVVQEELEKNSSTQSLPPRELFSPLLKKHSPLGLTSTLILKQLKDGSPLKLQRDIKKNFLLKLENSFKTQIWAWEKAQRRFNKLKAKLNFLKFCTKEGTLNSRPITSQCKKNNSLLFKQFYSQQEAQAQ